ncbi:MAG: membrane protein insertase YidC, partial [Gammaproteobacteria bacterium]|nr:membrane protein insertase YidC [Gammaproteobacteria bacterium]
MEQNRTLLLIALAVVSFLMWDAWQRDYGPQPQVTQTPTTGSKQLGGNDLPTATDVPSNASATTPTAKASSSTVPQQASSNRLQSKQRIKITTDVFAAEVDTFGGDLRVVDLVKYPTDVKKPDDYVRLFKDDQPGLFVAQSGFAGKKSKSNAFITKSPNHYSVYKSTQSSYSLKDGQDTLDVAMSWTSPEGVVFTKHYIFKRGSYEIEVKDSINNKTGKEWRGNAYYQLQRSKPDSDGTSQFVYSYLGGVIYSPDKKYQKIDFDDMSDENLSRDIKGGWAAMIQHYFLGAWVPAAEQNFKYFTRALDNSSRFVIGYTALEEKAVAAGSSSSISSRLFVGPKLQNQLEKVAPGLELTVDYGWLTVVSKPLFWLLDWLHEFLGNWGWAIIVVTILIKLAFYKLSEASYKSMANMRRIHPRLVGLKERYGDDKQKMHQAMMDIYRKEKINPL